MENSTQKNSPERIVCEGVFTPTAKKPVSASVGLPESSAPILGEFSDLPGAKDQQVSVTFRSGDNAALRVTANSNTPALPTVGFGTQTYYGEVNGHKFRLEPVAGEQHLDPEKAEGCPPGYRFMEWADRLGRGPVEFRWVDLEDTVVERGVLSFSRERRSWKADLKVSPAILH